MVLSADLKYGPRWRSNIRHFSCFAVLLFTMGPSLIVLIAGRLYLEPLLSPSVPNHAHFSHKGVSFIPGL